MLTINCYYYGNGGWARHAQGLVRALAARGVPLGLIPNTMPRHGETMSPLECEMVVRAAACPYPDVVVGVGPFEMMPHLHGRVKIAYVVWETTRIPKWRVNDLRAADEIWTPTEWGRELLVSNGVPRERIAVVPEGVDTDVFSPAPVPRTDARFRFLYIGKWEERKATRELVCAFAEAFAPDDPVELYLHAWNPITPHVDLADRVRRIAPGGDPPILTGPPLDERALLALYHSADAFVLPTRAEGWGLPILEAMACGLPAIVTDYGGHRAFASDRTGYLIRVDGMCEARDPVFFQGADFGQWAQPDFAHLRDLLRHVAADRDAARALGAAARAEACRWTWDNAAGIALERLARWAR